MSDKEPIKQQLILGVLYGVLGFVFDRYFVIPVYGNLSLHFGEIFVIFCLVTRGLAPALLASVITSAGLFLITGNAIFFITLLLEVVILNYLLRRGVVLLVADLLFWLVIGLPLTYVVIKIVYEISAVDFTLVILLKQTLNGILIVSIVSLMRPFAPISWYSQKQKITSHRLKDRIFELSLNSIALPSLIVALILSDSFADSAERQLASLLKVNTEHYVSSIENYLEKHQTALKNVNYLLTISVNSRLGAQQLLEEWQKSYKGFTTMLITDSAGNVIHGAPEFAFEKIMQLPVEQRRVVDRDYFLTPKDTLGSYLSDVFQGRGFGDAPIVAISSPIIRENKFAGIVEGSLDLPQFDGVEQSQTDKSHALLVVDSNNYIVYASPELQLPIFELFTLTHVSQSFTNNLPVLRLEERSYIYQSDKTYNDWTVYSLADSSVLIGSYKQSFFRLTIILLIISLLALVFARRFSRQITMPLETIVKHFSAQNIIPTEPSSVYTSKEIESVRKQLQEAQRLTLEYQENLKNEVASKTAELVAMNQKLEQMSLEDPLTHIYNRRGFESATHEVFKLASRNKTPLTLAVLDIDRFKDINDVWGHGVGDECIVMVAKELKKSFQRETDFYARYGGEEFVVMLTGGSIEIHWQMLEQLRQDIESHEIIADDEIVHITVSIGVYSLQEDFDLEYHQLVSRADKLLYQSKNAGRNRNTCDSQ